MDTIAAPAEATLDTSSLAARWHTSPGRLANLRGAQDGPAYFRVGRRVLYRLVDVLAFESATRIDPSA